MNKIEVYWNRPSYAGMCILDLSKLHMYRFHYDKIIDQYGYDAKLLFTDTDSLTYELKTRDVYSDMLKHLDDYDTSDYPSGHPCHSMVNAKTLGKFKDECSGKVVLEFVGLRPKMYSLLLPDDLEKNAVKGISRSYVKKCIRHGDFQKCLETGDKTVATFYTIRSFDQKLQTIKVVKDALSPYDNKRAILYGGTDTLSYSHWRLEEYDHAKHDILIRTSESILFRSYC